MKTEEPIKGVPNSFEEIAKSKIMTTKEKGKKEIKQDLIEKVVERHLDKKEKAKAVKTVLKQQGENRE